MKTQQEKRKPLHFVLILIFLLGIALPGFGRIKVNMSPIAFESMMLKGSSMNQFVVEGASYFLKSHSSYLDLLGKIEISEIESVPIGVMIETADSAIRNMEDTIVAYDKLQLWAAATPYNPDIIKLLKTFNYTKFLQDNDLNPALFWKVRDYLKDGDVCGIYDKMLEDSQRILAMLGKIEAGLVSGTIPKNYSLWRLNQEYLESLIFDQYVAMVFYAIQ